MYRSINFCRVILPLFFMFSISIIKTTAQDLQKDYKNNPEWIRMIGDPAANYYEAIKAYDTYWKYHEKPRGEEEELNGQENNLSGKMSEKEKQDADKRQKEHKKEIEKESKRKLSEEDLLNLEQKREMTYQCKRFEQWIRDVKPFVQNDGRILSPEEQMDIYNKQMEEQRRQNNK